MKTITMRLNNLAKLLGIAFLVILVYIFRPYPTANKDNTFIIEGKLERISSPCCNDIAFKIQGDHRNYYINRGLEKGISLSDLQTELIQENIRITGIKHWSPIDPLTCNVSIAAIKKGNKVIYRL